MATAEDDQDKAQESAEKAEEEPPILYWKLAREGTSLLLNNKQLEAEALFKAYPNSLEMCTGYVYAVFIDALMTFEDDKINLCLEQIKNLEKKCSAFCSTSWMKIVKSKMFGGENNSSQKELECQIILADTHVFVAMLTFLQQDISGFIKGGWSLRKSYKNYQSAYNTILELYKEIVGDDNIPPTTESASKVAAPPPTATTSEISNPNPDHKETHSKPLTMVQLDEVLKLASEMERKEPVDCVDPAAAQTEENQSKDEAIEKIVKETFGSQDLPTPEIQETNYQNEQQPNVSSEYSGGFPPKKQSSTNKNGYIPLSSKYSRSNPKHSISYHAGLSSCASKVDSQKLRKNGFVFPKSTDEQRFLPLMKKSTSANSGLTKLRDSNEFTPSSSSFFNLSSLSIFSHSAAKNIDRDAISRLLCAVSFGYGLIQLGISLLPPTMLKLVNFFGFSGSRKVGIENLMFARQGDDLRAPFATLTLLWYHTIVRPFFALDGNNVQAGVDAAAALIDEMMPEFEESSLFLFFRGRVERLRSEIPEAIDTFQAAITNAAQKEIKLMSMHEVGWCYLIELNHASAETAFQYLKEQSRWSKPFYSYLCIVSAGSNHMFQEVQSALELRKGFQPVVKGTQLDEFLTRRYKICPLEEESLKCLNFVFWKILEYELLYLWNTLPSCNKQNIDKIIIDCDEAWSLKVEPFLGLSRLIAGSCSCILGKYPEGITYFREGIEVRKSLPSNREDAHISAFSKYELGMILIKNPETLPEGKRLLEAASIYKGYDFEQRLSVRVHAILKTL